MPAITLTFERVAIIVTVPDGHIEPILDAISNAGGATIGEYTHCSFTNGGTGRFKPSAQANPHLGDHNTINQVDEWRIETFCEVDKASAVVSAIKQAHPYEEAVVYVLPLLDPDAL